MDVKEVISLPTKQALFDLRDRLNLSDRQNEIFYLKYGRLWRNIDIAAELDICQDTVSAEIKVIREKLAQISLDSKEDVMV